MSHTNPKICVPSTMDPYALLGLDSSCTAQKKNDTAYRKAARLWHPDKIGNDPSSTEKFHQVSAAYQLLSDPISKAKYDNERAAQQQRLRNAELFEGKRRQMKDDLEAREKRARDDADQAQFTQLAEEGKRMRMEKQGALKKETEQEKFNVHKDVSSPTTNRASNVPELDRTVKVRWPVESADDMIEESHIATLFSIFGKVENITLLGARSQKKKKVAICMIQYVSIVGAHSAVKEFPKQKGREWERFNLVYWAGNKEPESISEQPSDINNVRYFNSTAPSTATTASQPATPIPSGSTYNKKTPSFSSFSAASSTPRGSPLNRSLGVNGPTLEEMTMIRLKNAEKKRLAEELQRDDNAAMGLRNPM